MEAPGPSSEAVAVEDQGIHVGTADVLCVGPIVASVVYAYAGIPLNPLLLGTHPLLLSLLRGGVSAIIATGAFASEGRLPLWQVMLAPLPILMVTDPFLYWAGRRYGRWILDNLAGGDARRQRRIDRGERIFRRFGPWAIATGYFLPAPTALFYVAAGETRMPIWQFAAADIAGTVAWVGFLVALGWRLGDRGVGAAEAVSRYGLWLTVALVAGVVVMTVVRTRRQLRRG